MNWSALTFNWWLIVPFFWTLPAIYFLVRFGIACCLVWRFECSNGPARLREQLDEVLAILGLTFLLDMLVVLARVLP